MMNKLSVVDITAVKRLKESIGWVELEKEMKLMIEDLRDLLEESGENADMHRGRIDGIRTILAWPDVVLEEAKSREENAN